MDILTHGLLPYGAMTALGRSRRERAAAAIGGLGPDLDTATAWVASPHPAWYPFVHRGVSHTLIGAPAYAVVLFLLVGLPPLRRRWPRLGVFAPGRDVVVALLVGAMSHVALDMLTITGVAPFWPWSPARFTANLFFFSVSLAIPIAAVVWWPLLRGRATDRWVKRGSLALVLFLVLAGGLRVATEPRGLPVAAVLTPGLNEWTWTVSERNDTGVLVRTSNWGHLGAPRFLPETNRSAPAVAACLRDRASTAWRWDAWGLPVADARALGGGAWRVDVRDSAREAFGSFGGSGERGVLHCAVAADGSVRVEGHASFWGG